MSSTLDDELAEAIGPQGAEADAPIGPSAVSAAPAPKPVEPRPAARSLGLLATLLVMVGGVVALFLFGFKEAAIYATPIDSFKSGQAQLVGRKVRVEGELVPGTLVKRDQPCEYRFTVHGLKEQLPVRYVHCTIPDGLRDVPTGGVQVTVEGALTAQGEFEATQVMAKCASKYDPNTHTMKDGPASAAQLPIN